MGVRGSDRKEGIEMILDTVRVRRKCRRCGEIGRTKEAWCEACPGTKRKMKEHVPAHGTGAGSEEESFSIDEHLHLV